MNRKQVRQKVLDILEAQYGIDKATISGSANFREDLGATDFDMMKTFHTMEEEFNISFLWKEAESIETISEMIDLIVTKQ